MRKKASFTFDERSLEQIEDVISHIDLALLGFLMAILDAMGISYLYLKDPAPCAKEK